MSLTPELLLHAYSVGVFPMSEHRDDPEIFWVDPKRRGILPLDGFHISRSLAKRIRNGGFSITINRDFAGVVAGCADRPDTWINGEIFDRYMDLHRIGHAHSIEVRHGESMFSRQRDASKVALAYLVDRLRQGGFALCDTQFLTDHLASLGAIEISRAAYRRQLRDAMEGSGDFTRPRTPTPHSLLQRMAQTS